MLEIYGRNDDLVYANIKLQQKCSTCGCKIEEPTQAVVCESEEEFYALNKEVRFVVGDPYGGVVIAIRYEENGTWSGKIVQIDEDIRIPWPVTVEANDYSAVVRVDCPNGTPVKMEKRGD